MQDLKRTWWDTWSPITHLATFELFRHFLVRLDTRDIQTNELLHSQDSKMTDEKSKPMNRWHEICGVGEDHCIKYKWFIVGICGWRPRWLMIEIPKLTITASNASNVDVDVDGVNVDGSKAKRWRRTNTHSNIPVLNRRGALVNVWGIDVEQSNQSAWGPTQSLSRGGETWVLYPPPRILSGSEWIPSGIWAEW